MPMKVTVIGLGYLGATHSVAMSKLGHTVVGIEKDPKKLEILSQGRAGFFEPGLDQALQEELASGRLTFQSEHDANSSAAEIHFICVGTPQSKNSLAADTTYLHSAITYLAPHLKPESVVVGKVHCSRWDCSDSY